METNGLTHLSAPILEETFLRFHVYGPSKRDFRQYYAREICYELFGLLSTLMFIV